MQPPIKYQFAMVQINDGQETVTIHDTEEAAYDDIVETCMGDPFWIGLNTADPDNQEELDVIVADIDAGIPSKEIYDKHLEPRLEGHAAGFYMSVTIAGVHPDSESLLNFEAEILAIYPHWLKATEESERTGEGHHAAMIESDVYEMFNSLMYTLREKMTNQIGDESPAVQG